MAKLTKTKAQNINDTLQAHPQKLPSRLSPPHLLLFHLNSLEILPSTTTNNEPLRANTHSEPLE